MGIVSGGRPREIRWLGGEKGVIARRRERWGERKGERMREGGRERKREKEGERW